MIDNAVVAMLEDLGALYASGRKLEVVEQCQARLEADPNCTPAMMVMGLIAWSQGDQGLAIQLLERAHGIEPNCREFADILASMHTQIGHIPEGLYYAKLAIAAKRDRKLARWVPAELGSYHASLGAVGLSRHYMNAEFAFRLGNFENAVKECREELRINRDHLDCMLVLARAQVALGQGDAAVAVLRAASHVAPRSAWVHAWLGHALIACGLHDQAMAHQRLALALDPEDEAVQAQVAGDLHYQTDANWQAALPLLEGYAGRVEDPARAGSASPYLGRLTGFVWDQCHQGPLFEFVAPLLKGLDETVLYRLNVRKDFQTDVLTAAAMRARDEVDVDDLTLGLILVGDQLGRTVNLCAPGPVAKFPLVVGATAPKVLQWLSEPLADRLPTASAVIGGPETADLDARLFGDGNVIALDRLVACEFPKLIGPAEELSGLPREIRGHPVFGVWGDFRRFSKDVVALWAQVLWAVPEALLLIGGRDDWEVGTAERVVEWFGEYGLGARIRFQTALDPELAKTIPALSEFWRNIDLMLDATPVSGGYEIARALWMGVPVVTLRGQRRIGRLGASILHAAGCGEWIASDAAGYVAIAARLANAPDLAGLRAGLRARIEASPLADVDGFASQFAAAIGAKPAFETAATPAADGPR